jgi:hypothetical protein
MIANSTQAPAAAWKRRAAELAQWALDNLVNRTDAWGINKKDGSRATGHGPLDLHRLQAHFRGDRLIGVHLIGLDNTCKFIAIDIDAHGDTPDVAAKNMEIALELDRRAHEVDLHTTISDSNGKGGYHLKIIFSRAISAQDAYYFGMWLARGFKPNKPGGIEVFPKRADRDSEKGYGGGWIRADGKHHKHDHWTKVWSPEGEWLEGDEAINALLAHVGDDPGKLASVDYMPPPVPPPRPPTAAILPGDRPANAQERARHYLNKLEPPDPRPENPMDASTQLLKGASVCNGFALDESTALQLLAQWDSTNPCGRYPDSEYCRKLRDALKEKPMGWILAQDQDRKESNDVNLDGIVNQGMEHGNGELLDSETPETPEPDPEPEVLAIDPGTTPSHLLSVPGFINELRDYCIAVAPYPNEVLAFGGALAMQGHLAGRKIRDSADNRTNLYLLLLALPGAGKDMPRKLNMQIADSIGLASTIGERFASGEGLEDALFTTPCMLFQNDEIDSMLQAISKRPDANNEGIMGLMLKLYTSASSKFQMRRKAGKEARTINQPHLTILGTAVPTHYYRALSDRMLTNGFFARTLVMESGPRGKGQEAKIPQIPLRIYETAQVWASRGQELGNLIAVNPEPAIIPYNDQAEQIATEFRAAADVEWQKAADAGDPIATALWARANETARRLALIYAASENHMEPVVTGPAIQWAGEFVDHHVHRMLFMAQEHSADSPFHQMCQTVKQKLRSAPGKRLPHWKLLKMLKTDSKTFGQVIQTLTEQWDVRSEIAETGGRKGVVYRLLTA